MMGLFSKLFAKSKKPESRPATSVAAEQLIKELSAALQSGNVDREDEVRSLIVQHGGCITRALARAALEFDPDHPEDDPTEVKFRLSRAALGCIGKIGQLDEDMVQALFAQFIRERSGRDAYAANWGGVFSTAVDTLEKLGYRVVE